VGERGDLVIESAESLLVDFEAGAQGDEPRSGLVRQDPNCWMSATDRPALRQSAQVGDEMDDVVAVATVAIWSRCEVSRPRCS